MPASTPFKPLRILGLGILLGAIVLLAINGKQWWPALEEMISQSGPTGFLLFMGLFVGLTILCFPVSVLGFTAGALYGPWFGLLLLYPSGLFSGTLMFFLGRGLLRELVQGFVNKNPRLLAIEKAAGHQAVRLNILTRLSPFNFGLASYALAVGNSGFRAYLLGVLVILPSMTAQVWVGALARKTGGLRSDGAVGNPLEMGLLTLGILFFLGLSWQIGKLVKQALSTVETDSRDS